MGNFAFLESHWGDLAKLGDLSEKYVYSDPNTSIIKQGMLSEVMVKYMLAYDGIERCLQRCSLPAVGCLIVRAAVVGALGKELEYQHQQGHHTNSLLISPHIC